MITQEGLKELLHYGPETGVFTWKVRRKGTGGVGSVAGCLKPGGVGDGGGYVYICIDYRSYAAHRLAWLWEKGEWPKNTIDHKDHNRAHNAIRNLREATSSQNSGHAHGHKEFPGTQRNGARWSALIMVSGVRHYLGTYDTREEAAAVYKDAAVKQRGEFAPAQYQRAA